MEQPELDFRVEVFAFLDFRQNSEGGSSTVNASVNIEFYTTTSRNNIIKEYKLIDAFNLLLTNVNKKSAMSLVEVFV